MSIVLKRVRRLFLAVLWLLLATLPPASWGQLPGDAAKPQAEPVTAGTETTEQVVERLKETLAVARQSLASGQALLESTPPEQLGATVEEVHLRLRLLNTRVLYLGQHIEAYRTLEETRRATKDLVARVETWQGFEDPPPYSITLVDELRDARHAQHLAISRDDVRKNLLEQEHGEARQALKDSEQRLRQTKEALEKPLEGAELLRSNWLNDLAQLETEVAGAKALSTQTQLQVANESLALHRKTLDFLERQIQIARADTAFTREELEQKLEAITQRQKAFEKEELRTVRNNNRNQEKLQQAREALQKTRQSLGQGAEDEQKIHEEIKRLQQMVEVRKAWVDTSAKIVELRKLVAFRFNAEKLLWEERHRLTSTKDESELQEAGKFIADRLEKTREYRAAIESSLKLAQSLSLNQAKRLDEGTLAKDQQPLARQMLEAYQKRVEFLTQSLADIDDLARQGERFQEAIADRRQRITTKEHLQFFFDDVLKVAGNIWNYEIFTVEDTIVVKGQPVTERRPVTISKVVRALLILVIGLWLTFRYENRIHQVAVRLFKLEAGAALLVQQVFKALVVIGLLVFALITVKIPLTIFAFMGGALAIGVGFGAQALINNFISGFILLFERPIKVGDQVEVEGTRGKVVHIGTRCSQVRRFDGVDILVPNSAFLEKNIVNYTLSDQLIRLTVKVGVAYGSPTREVSKIISNALEQHGRILKDPEPVILFEDFGDSALIFSVYFWVEILPTADTRIVASDLRHMLDKRFREAGITIAFPQIDVHFDSAQPVQMQMAETLPKEKTDKPPQGPEDG